jgi:hypothetical protein
LAVVVEGMNQRLGCECQARSLPAFQRRNGRSFDRCTWVADGVDGLLQMRE